ncbi:MAG: hydrogenase maturation peptidase HycI [Methanobacteriaceae archaeon]|jgi:hydrogenase 3 maturation protease
MVLEQQLKKFLKNHGKVVIMGIGNEIKGDDAIGPNTAWKLDELFKKNDEVLVLDGGTVPENYTNLIRKENPTHIILVDAVEMKNEPGYIRIVKKEEIADYNLSTHAMPVSFLIKFMETTIDADIILIGIQPEKIDLGEGISKEVEKSIGIVVNTLFELIN